MKKVLVTILTVLLALSFAMSVNAESNKLLAFPGAIGGGKYATGARGILDEEDGKIEVYHVTNLNASGEGSFVDAISKSGRIIVFDISGTIELNGTLKIKKNNLTILGQTAPGDGITISGGDIITDDEVKNVIIRYLRVRPSDKNGGEPDGIGGRFNENIIFDHCSSSWCVDELLTLYAGPKEEDKKTPGNHLTMQNTIGSESLRMSNHVKGAHGYGAIWGGDIATYAYNLLAHHDSRSPRMDRQIEETEVVNNVIYDWGQTNSAYGAEPYSSNKQMKIPSEINWIGNYYKYGPSTRASLRSRIFDVSSPLASTDEKSKFYFFDNYVFDSATVTANNKYGLNNATAAEILDTKIDMGEYAVEPMSAEDAYDYVLANAGATLPRRDAIDARIINDVKYGTGRTINNANDVAGFVPVESETRKFEIPSEWLIKNGLTGKNETDIVESGEFSGYTVIEAYVNDWTEEQSKNPPTNPEIVVQSPAIASVDNKIKDLAVDNGNWTVVNEDEGVDYKATAFAVGGNDVTKMELYDGSKSIGSFEGSSIDTHIDLKAGTHYLTCRAYNTRDEKTQSTTSIVYVKATSEPGSYLTAEIGSPSYKGKGGASMDEKGIYTIYGSGRITTKSSDSCQFMYKEVTGDFDVTVRVESIPKFENQQVSGLMVRAGLENNAVMAMIGDGWVKNGENVRIFSRATAKANASEIYFKDSSGNNCDNSSTTYSMPKYMRIQRKGNELTFSVSNTGIIWNDNARQPVTVTYSSLPETMYVGLATDTANGVSTKEYFSVAQFSELVLNGESDVEIDNTVGSLPFMDTRFNDPLWYSDNGSGERNNEDGVIGNNGYIQLFWGTTSRNFKSQNNGIVNLTTDYFCGSKDSVNHKAGVRFKLSGCKDNEDTVVKIASMYAQHAQGFYNEYESTEPIPTIDPDFATTFDINKWYKIEMQLNYNTGKGKFVFKPYTEYNSDTETYVTGDAIYEYSFDFDTSIAVCQFSAQRLGGWAMYLDNVEAEVKTVKLYTEDNNIVIENLNCDADLYVVKYINGKLSDAVKAEIAASEKIVRTSPYIPAMNEEIRIYLWDKNLSALCKPVKID